MRAVKAFWWSPRRSPRILAEIGRYDLEPWAFLATRHASRPDNFGDEFARLAIAEVTGREVSWVPPSRAELLAVGSILEYYSTRQGRGAQIWGTGLKFESGDSVELVAERIGQILALRGPLTAQKLESPEVPYGDPGVLCRALVPRGPRNRAAQALLVPHFGEFATHAGRRRIRELQRGGLRVVLPTTPPLSVISAIWRASGVVTSSLHGLIFSHALGTPAVLMSSLDPTGHTPQPNFKYRDYAEAVGFDARRASFSELEDTSRRDQLLLAAESQTAALESATNRCALSLREVARGIA